MVLRAAHIAATALLVVLVVPARCGPAWDQMQRANGTDYFPSVTMGAMRRSCIYGLDYWPTYPPPSTVGRWEYRIDATGPFVTYNDPDAAHPLDGYSYRFVDADCAVRRINGQGDWVDITLGDL